MKVKTKNKVQLPRNYRPSAATSALPAMRLIDLQRHCIIRGIQFELLVTLSVFQMQSWLDKHWDIKTETKRLDEFDQWRLDYMKSKGMPADEPFIRLGYIGSRDEKTGEITSFLKPRKMKKTKVKRERDTKMGIFKGTKKALAFQCFQEGLDREKTIQKVISIFPDAKEKSIKIWWKTASKSIKVK
jgi:hypothetical protein